MPLPRKDIFLIWVLPLIVGVAPMFAGDGEKSIVASRTFFPPRIDGFLTESQWDSAVPASGFLQFDPDEGVPATEPTSVRILYDDQALYIGVICYDSNRRGIVRQLSRRDRSAEADKFTVIIDSYHDHATSFVFSATVSGVQTDGILSQAGRMYDVQWDAVWKFAASTGRDGWYAEFAIPLTALRFNPEHEMIWGINFRRYVARKGELSEWVLVPRKEGSTIPKMGHLAGLKDVANSHPVELMPYVVSRAEFEPRPSPFTPRKEVNAKAGFDLKLGLSNEVTLDATINPDFGQVEVDRSVINLTVFETLYPEKRPFFLEGKQIFTFGETYDRRSLQLFYSRRIGQRPTQEKPLPTGYAYAENPLSTTILGATKLTGRTAGGLTFAGLAAITDREFSSFKDINGKRTDRYRIEPRASYNVVRLRQDVLENSAVGLMATSAFKEELGPAYSGGIDWNLRFDRGTYLAEGYLAGSQYSNSRGRQIHGSAGKLFGGKVAGEHWLGITTYDYASPRFWINDLGFFNRPREHGGASQIIYKNDRVGGSVIRRYSFSGELSYRWNFDRIKTSNELELESVMEFSNFWYTQIILEHEFPAHDDPARGIFGLYRRPTSNLYRLTLSTDARKPVQAELSGALNKPVRDGYAWLTSIKLTIRPSAATELTPSVSLVRSRYEEAWVYTPGGAVVGNTYDPAISPQPFSFFGDRDYDEIDFSLRGILAFTPEITLQFFGQVLLDKGRFVNFRRLIGPGEFAPYDYSSASYYIDPTFNEKSMNANVVVRWEYMPGSTIYFVWTHSRYGGGGLFTDKLKDNFSNAFRLPADNHLALKISYWWNN